MAIVRRGMSGGAVAAATIVAQAVDQEVEITPPITTDEAAAAVVEAQEALDDATESGDTDAIADAQEVLDVAEANQVAAGDMIDAVTGETMLAAGQTVSLVDVGGTLRYVPSGCLEDNYPTYFFGVVLDDAAQGSLVKVATGRGSIVTPLTEEDSDLDPAKPVFISLTPGRVTQDTSGFPFGSVILKIGQAVTTAKMILNNDYYSYDYTIKED